MAGRKVNAHDDALFERIQETFHLPVDEAAARLGTNCCTQRSTFPIAYCDHIGVQKVCARLSSRRLAVSEASEDGRFGRSPATRACRAPFPQEIRLQLTCISGKIIASQARLHIAQGVAKERLELKIRKFEEEKTAILANLKLDCARPEIPLEGADDFSLLVNSAGTAVVPG
jgi:hypothetical protein